jgi:hypothetical protein
MANGFTRWITSPEAWGRWGYGYRRTMAAVTLRDHIAVQLARPACPACAAPGGEPCDPAMSAGTLVRAQDRPLVIVHLERAQTALAAGFLDPVALRAPFRETGALPDFLAGLEDGRELV